MNRQIGIIDFRSAINELLEDYGDKVNEALEKAIDETAEESVDELKRSGEFKGRKYRNSWTSEEVRKRLSYGRTVFNKKHYRLTHLLEFGHVKQNGGRTRAFPHIAPVNEKVERRVLTRLTYYVND